MNNYYYQYDWRHNPMNNMNKVNLFNPKEGFEKAQRSAYFVGGQKLSYAKCVKPKRCGKGFGRRGFQPSH